MSDDIKKVVSRIRKMLALANNAAASEGERDNAMRMVHSALAKYNLSMSSVNEEENKRMDSLMITRGHTWARMVGGAIANLMFCEHFVEHMRDDRAHIKQYFVGRESNVTTAQELTNFVIESIGKEANRRTREGGHNGGWHRSFCKGAGERIHKRCEEIRRSAEKQEEATPGTALVLASLYKQEEEANDQFLKQSGIRLVTKRNLARNTQLHAHMAGFAFAGDISLNSQVGSSAPTGRLK